MSRPPGFVPIQFHKLGKAMLVVGITALLITVLSSILGWFSYPPAILYASIAAILVGLYMIFIVPTEASD
jgi:hypothetical protein